MTILEEVIADLRSREQRGIAKYGRIVDDNPISHTEWLRHAYEEALDMAIYLKRAMREPRTSLRTTNIATPSEGGRHG